MVIDMLNMSARQRWAQKAYTAKRADPRYTDFEPGRGLDEPRMVELPAVVDPYSMRRYTMPKLLLWAPRPHCWSILSALLDAFPRRSWSSRPECWADLGGGEAALQSGCFRADRASVGSCPPCAGNSNRPTPTSRADPTVDQATRKILLWTADSIDRDFRMSAGPAASWRSSGQQPRHAEVERPPQATEPTWAS